MRFCDCDPLNRIPLTGRSRRVPVPDPTTCLLPQPNTADSIYSMGDLRQHDRTTYRGKINLMWADESGNPYSSNGVCMDISESGLKIKVDSQLPVRSVVTV